MQSLLAEGSSPRDVADVLAEHKARKISTSHPEDLVLGCDQVLAFQNRLFLKPETEDMAVEQLMELQGLTHRLLSAAVVYRNGMPVWRSIGEADLTMHDMSKTQIQRYVSENWTDIKSCVGAYQVEAAGVRLFSEIKGDYFSVLGLPLLQILGYLRTIGWFEP
ncbi:Maf-like protein [Litoreibacter roseus]|uniref:Nucleoside triphosphate pyrophosphatase n=2 Tax=Litoreibacter roseus TaxID=2601869 RepID=A0A6N6JDZ3_9RHOB|nr:Maf-like protein [Litoreibacter roseus]